MSIMCFVVTILQPRHSHESGNPEAWIPVFTGMTTEEIRTDDKR